MRPHHSDRSSRSQTAAKAYRLSGALGTSEVNDAALPEASREMRPDQSKRVDHPPILAKDSGGVKDSSAVAVGAAVSAFVTASATTSISPAVASAKPAIPVVDISVTADTDNRPQRAQTTRRKSTNLPSSTTEVLCPTGGVPRRTSVAAEAVPAESPENSKKKPHSAQSSKSQQQIASLNSIKKTKKESPQKTECLEYPLSSDLSSVQSDVGPESEAVCLSIRCDGVHLRKSTPPMVSDPPATNSSCDASRAGSPSSDRLRGLSGADCPRRLTTLGRAIFADTIGSADETGFADMMRFADGEDRVFPRCVPEDALEAESAATEVIRGDPTSDDLADGGLSVATADEGNGDGEVQVEDQVSSGGVIPDRTSVAPVSPRKKGTLQQRLHQAEFALRCSQAELAVSRLETLSAYTAPSIRQRLEAILQVGVKHLGCDATAFYMIDPTETSLRLHVSQGLPASRFTEAPRLLHTARADLNAMLGDVVSFEEDAELPISWNSPEPEFPSAICARVSSPTRIHGTLWAFSRQYHGFAELEMQYWLQTASRIAMELENELLTRKNRQEDQTAEFCRSLERRRRMQFPSVGPFLDGWEFSGYTVTKNAWRSGTGYDWFCGQEGMILTLSEAGGNGPIAAISASELRMALRALAPEATDMSQLLQRIHRTLWMASAGDEGFAVFAGHLHPQTGAIRFATAGSPGVFLVLPQDIYNLSVTSDRFATSPEMASCEPEHEEVIAQGAAMLLLSQEPSLSTTAMRRLKRTLLAHLSQGAAAMSVAVREFFVSELPMWWNDSRSMLVIRHRS